VDIIAQAGQLARPLAPSKDCRAASVGAVVVSASSRVYTGVCVEFGCGIGFCVEHAAVAVDEAGKVLPPCGRCREIMWQLDPANRDALVVLGADRALPLRELLPIGNADYAIFESYSLDSIKK
jgi:cytidine deaminase